MQLRAAWNLKGFPLISDSARRLTAHLRVRASPAFLLRGPNPLSQDRGFMSRCPAQFLNLDLMMAEDVDGL